MKTLFALLVGLLVAFGCNAQTSAGPAPIVWTFAGSRSYDESQGLGNSQHFSSSFGVIDVYSYGLKRTDWINGTSDPQFAKEFAATLEGLSQLAAQGLLSDLKPGPTRDVTVAGQPFRAATFNFTLKGRPRDSAVYLTARDGQLLKYRITVLGDSSPGVIKLAEGFIARDLSSRPTRGH